MMEDAWFPVLTRYIVFALILSEGLVPGNEKLPLGPFALRLFRAKKCVCDVESKGREHLTVVVLCYAPHSIAI